MYSVDARHRTAPYEDNAVRNVLLLFSLICIVVIYSYFPVFSVFSFDTLFPYHVHPSIHPSSAHFQKCFSSLGLPLSRSRFHLTVVVFSHVYKVGHFDAIPMVTFYHHFFPPPSPFAVPPMWRLDRVKNERTLPLVSPLKWEPPSDLYRLSIASNAPVATAVTWSLPGRKKRERGGGWQAYLTSFSPVQARPFTGRLNYLWLRAPGPTFKKDSPAPTSSYH